MVREGKLRIAKWGRSITRRDFLNSERGARHVCVSKALLRKGFKPRNTQNARKTATIPFVSRISRSPFPPLSEQFTLRRNQLQSVAADVTRHESALTCFRLELAPTDVGGYSGFEVTGLGVSAAAARRGRKNLASPAAPCN